MAAALLSRYLLRPKVLCREERPALTDQYSGDKEVTICFLFYNEALGMGQEGASWRSWIPDHVLEDVRCTASS